MLSVWAIRRISTAILITAVISGIGSLVIDGMATRNLFLAVVTGEVGFLINMIATITSNGKEKAKFSHLNSTMHVDAINNQLRLRPQTVQELAKATNLSKALVYRMLKDLEVEGIVQRTAKLDRSWLWVMKRS